MFACRVASSFTVLAGIENTGDDESLYQQLAVDAIYLVHSKIR